MPALPNVPKVLKNVITYQVGVDFKVVNVLHWQYAGANSQADNDTLCEAIENAWENNILTQLNNATTLESVVLTDLTSPSAPQSTVISNFAGGVAGAVLPAGVAAVVQHRISRRYRGGKPRTYLGGLSGTQLASASAWTAGFVTGMAAQWVLFTNAVKGAATAGQVSIVDGQVSYYQGGTNVLYPSGRYHRVPTLRVGGPLFDPFTAVSINPKPGSQRRRNLQSA